MFRLEFNIRAGYHDFCEGRDGGLPGHSAFFKHPRVLSLWRSEQFPAAQCTYTDSTDSWEDLALLESWEKSHWIFKPCKNTELLLFTNNSLAGLGILNSCLSDSINVITIITMSVLASLSVSLTTLWYCIVCIVQLLICPGVRGRQLQRRGQRACG